MNSGEDIQATADVTKVTCSFYELPVKAQQWFHNRKTHLTLNGTSRNPPGQKDLGKERNWRTQFLTRHSSKARARHSEARRGTGTEQVHRQTAQSSPRPARVWPDELPQPSPQLSSLTHHAPVARMTHSTRLPSSGAARCWWPSLS